jgi:hypothetical protein
MNPIGAANCIGALGVFGEIGAELQLRIIEESDDGRLADRTTT